MQATHSTYTGVILARKNGLDLYAVFFAGRLVTTCWSIEMANTRLAQEYYKAGH